VGEAGMEVIVAFRVRDHPFPVLVERWWWLWRAWTESQQDC